MRALVLFAHGARDPRWAEPFDALVAAVQHARPDETVRLAYLELMQPSLPSVVEELAHMGVNDIMVVPVFLGQGGHVRRDLPALVEAMRERFSEVSIRCAVAVGEDPLVQQAVVDACIRALG